MSNTILYYASNADEVHQCAYSLLKCLEVYKLQPPANPSIVIYTNDQASLESYGSLFGSFQLRRISMSLHETLIHTEKETGGNILYLGAGSYPACPLESLFSSIENGMVYSMPALAVSKGGLPALAVAGFKSNNDPSFNPGQLKGSHPGECIVQYGNVKDFQALLRYFFKRYQEESVANQVKLIQRIDARTIEREHSAYQRLPFYVRWVRKALGRGWRIGDYAGKI